MKHYAKMNSYEVDELCAGYRRCYGGKAESLAETKRIYRQRERALLKRMTAKLAEEWEATPEERAYWHAKKEEHADEYERLYYEQLWIVEIGEEPSELVRAGMDAENRLYSAACAELRAA